MELLIKNGADISLVVPGAKPFTKETLEMLYAHKWKVAYLASLAKSGHYDTLQTFVKSTKMKGTRF